MSIVTTIARSHAPSPPPLQQVFPSPLRRLGLAHAEPWYHRVGRMGFVRLLLPLALIALWQAAAQAGWIDPRILEAPSRILKTLGELWDSGILLESLKASGLRSGQGFLYGALTGLALGLFSGLSRVGEQTYDILVHMLRMVPFLAIIPLLVVWFGVGEEPKIILIAVACVFPVYINTFGGVRNVDPKLIEAARVFGLNGVQIALKVVLPLALPTILIGIRHAMGTSLLALVAAEQVNATSGIGYLALNPRAALRTDIILAMVLIYASLGVLVDMVIRLAQRVLLPWRRDFRGERL